MSDKPRRIIMTSQNENHTITVRQQAGSLVFLPDSLQIFGVGLHDVEIILGKSVPEAVGFEEPYIILPPGAPFEVNEPSPDRRRLSLRNLNQENPGESTEYPYRLVLGLDEQLSRATPDPSIINHGTQGVNLQAVLAREDAAIRGRGERTRES